MLLATYNRSGRYDRMMLRVIVILGYCGWAAYSASSLLFGSHSSNVPDKTFTLIDSFHLSVFISCCALLAYQTAPWTYYVYLVFPFYFWNEVAKSFRGQWPQMKTQVEEREPANDTAKMRTSLAQHLFHPKSIKNVIFAFLSLQAMVVSVLAILTANNVDIHVSSACVQAAMDLERRACHDGYPLAFTLLADYFDCEAVHNSSAL